MEHFKNSYAIQVAAEKGNPEAQYLYGLESLKKDKTMRAFDNLSAAATKGHPLAMVEMGKLCLADFGGHNAEKAENWFQKAVETNDSEAIMQVGVIYYSGAGIMFNLRKAKALFEEAKSKGKKEADYYLQFIANNENLMLAACNEDAVAQYQLGNIYFDNRYNYSVKEMTDIALRWITLAANHDNTDAIFQLGKLYQEGTLVNRNLAVSQQWLEKAAKRGILEAKDRLNKIYDIQIIQFESSYGAIYDGKFYYNLINEPTARRLNGSSTVIDLDDIQILKYQRNRFHFIINTKEKELHFNLIQPQDYKDKSQGDLVVSCICSNCELRLSAHENDSIWAKVCYGVLSCIVLVINTILDLNIPDPGNSIIDVYSKYDKYK